MIRTIPGRPHPTATETGGRWLFAAALCLFLALSMHAHHDDGPCVDDRTGPQGEVPGQAGSSQPGYLDVVRDASLKHALDPNLIVSMIYVESRWNHAAVSPKGAKGLMQLTPVVYRHYGVDDPFDIEQNIHTGAAYLAYLLARFDGDLEMALAAYNCGPTRVSEHKGLPPIKETRDYVERVLEFYRKGSVPVDPSSRKS